MRVWVRPSVLVLMACGLVRPAASQDDCPATRPFQLTTAVAPVMGKSPLWVTPGRGPVAWKDPNTAVSLLFVRDRAIPGAAVVTARHRASGARVRFGKFGSTLGLREERFQLDALGAKPKTATAADFQKYTFHQSEAWFPESGCYEITGRVGREQAVIVLKVEQRAAK